MQAVKIVPKLCQKSTDVDEAGVEHVTEPRFEGFVMMLPPAIDERFEYMRIAGLKLDQAAEYSLDENLGMVMKIVPCLEKHVKEVNIKEIESGYQITSFDELRRDPMAAMICGELAGLLLKGFRPSKN